jgi:hypothetical protein
MDAINIKEACLLRNRRRDSIRWGVLGAALLAVIILVVVGNYQYTKDSSGGLDFFMQ